MTEEDQPDGAADVTEEDQAAGPWLVRAALVSLAALTVAETIGAGAAAAVSESDETSGLAATIVVFGAMAAVVGAVALPLARWRVVFALYAVGWGLWGMGVGFVLAAYGLGTLLAPAVLLLMAGLVGSRRTWPRRRLRRVAYGVTLAWAVPYALLLGAWALAG